MGDYNKDRVDVLARHAGVETTAITDYVSRLIGVVDGEAELVIEQDSADPGQVVLTPQAAREVRMQFEVVHCYVQPCRFHQGGCGVA